MPVDGCDGAGRRRVASDAQHGREEKPEERGKLKREGDDDGRDDDDDDDEDDDDEDERKRGGQRRRDRGKEGK